MRTGIQLIRILFILVSTPWHLVGVESDGTFIRRIRQSNFEDPRAALGSTGLGPSFRSKRDKDDVNSHAMKAEADDLAAAAESVAAQENAIAAAINTEKIRQSLQSKETSNDSKTDVEKKGEHGEDNEETESASAGGQNEKDGGHSENDKAEPQTGSASSSAEAHTPEKPENTQSENGQAHDGPSSIDPHTDSRFQKLMTESSELAKELRMVFDILAKREAQLVEEMKRLQEALNGAVSILKPTEETHQDSNKRYRRNYLVQESPYKACVYIESSPEPSQSNYGYGNNYNNYNGRSGQRKQVYPPEPIVREFIPPEALTSDMDYEDNADASDSESTKGKNVNKSANGQEDIDLSKVYWLKLPDNADGQSVRQKVQTVFAEVSGAGKDALIIPVSRGFSSSQEVSKGFLRAVKVKPTVAKSRYSRALRSLQIKEVS